MNSHFQLSAYDYHLPEENIAQNPAAKRDQSRLLILDCEKDRIIHDQFTAITDLLRPGDVIVANNTKVFPARLFGKKETGGKVEILLLHYPEKQTDQHDESGWYKAKATALLKSSKRPKPESTLFFADNLQARVLELSENGQVKLELQYRLHENESLDDLLKKYGQVPLPPYIKRPTGTTDKDLQRYQTKYAQHPGSVAAPTAGLHFSDALLEQIQQKGVALETVTLHVGYGTFAPVRTDDIRDHQIHSEYIEIPPQTAETINKHKKQGSRIWAVGTTTARTLEFAADLNGDIQPVQGPCDLYIYPGYRFKIVDNLITNFHLPRSSLLFLVSALAGTERILSCYQEAIQKGYRFYSYGDAMAIITKP